MIGMQNRPLGKMQNEASDEFWGLSIQEPC